MELLLTFISIMLLIICLILHEIRQIFRDLPELIDGAFTRLKMDMIRNEIEFIRNQVDEIKDDLNDTANNLPDSNN